MANYNDMTTEEFKNAMEKKILAQVRAAAASEDLFAVPDVPPEPLEPTEPQKEALFRAGIGLAKILATWDYKEQYLPTVKYSQEVKKTFESLGQAVKGFPPNYVSAALSLASSLANGVKEYGPALATNFAQKLHTLNTQKAIQDISVQLLGLTGDEVRVTSNIAALFNQVAVKRTYLPSVQKIPELFSFAKLLDREIALKREIRDETLKRISERSAKRNEKGENNISSDGERTLLLERVEKELMSMAAEKFGKEGSMVWVNRFLAEIQKEEEEYGTYHLLRGGLEKFINGDSAKEGPQIVARNNTEDLGRNYLVRQVEDALLDRPIDDFKAFVVMLDKEFDVIGQPPTGGLSVLEEAVSRAIALDMIGEQGVVTAKTEAIRTWMEQTRQNEIEQKKEPTIEFKLGEADVVGRQGPAPEVVAVAPEQPLPEQMPMPPSEPDVSVRVAENMPNDFPEDFVNRLAQLLTQDRSQQAEDAKKYVEKAVAEGFDVVTKSESGRPAYGETYPGKSLCRAAADMADASGLKDGGNPCPSVAPFMTWLDENRLHLAGSVTKGALGQKFVRHIGALLLQGKVSDAQGLALGTLDAGIDVIGRDGTGTSLCIRGMKRALEGRQHGDGKTKLYVKEFSQWLAEQKNKRKAEQRSKRIQAALAGSGKRPEEKDEGRLFVINGLKAVDDKNWIDLRSLTLKALKAGVDVINSPPYDRSLCEELCDTAITYATQRAMPDRDTTEEALRESKETLRETQKHLAKYKGWLAEQKESHSDLLKEARAADKVPHRPAEKDGMYIMQLEWN